MSPWSTLHFTLEFSAQMHAVCSLYTLLYWNIGKVRSTQAELSKLFAASFNVCGPILPFLFYSGNTPP